MQNPIEMVKAHPVIAGVTAVVAVGVVGFAVLGNHGGSGVAAPGPMVALPGAASSQGANDAIAAGVALEQLRTGKQLQMEATAAEERQNTVRVEAEKFIANLAATQAYNVNEANKTIALASNASSERISSLEINRDISIAGINRDVTLGGYSTQVQLAGIASNAAIVSSQNELNWNVAAANQATEQARIDAEARAKHDAAALQLAKINRAKGGLWQIIFGE